MVKESSICSVLGMTELIWGAKTVATTTSRRSRRTFSQLLVYFCHQLPGRQGHRSDRKGECAVATGSELIRVENVTKIPRAASQRSTNARSP